MTGNRVKARLMRKVPLFILVFGVFVSVGGKSRAEWRILGEPIHDDYIGGDFCLGIQSNGHPVVAYACNTTSFTLGRPSIYAEVYNGKHWESLGNPAAPTDIGKAGVIPNRLSMALDSSGRVYVCWTQLIGNGREIYLRYWDGKSWQELYRSASNGGISKSSGNCYLPTIAINKQNEIFVAWGQEIPRNSLQKQLSITGIAKGDKLMIRKFDGSKWIDLNNPISSHCDSAPAALAFDALNQPIIAWEEKVSSGPFSIKKNFWTEIYLARWNGTDWTGIGESKKEGGISQIRAPSESPTIDLTSKSMPLVAWLETLFSPKRYCIYVKMWNGSEWLRVGTSSVNDSQMQDETIGVIKTKDALALDQNDQAYIVWETGYEGGYSEKRPPADSIVKIRKWNGELWLKLDDSGIVTTVKTSSRNYSPDVNLNPRIVVGPNNMIYVAIREPQVQDENGKTLQQSKIKLFTSESKQEPKN